MTFANPWAWLGLIPLWGFILFLYFLRVRRRREAVSTAFLWPEQAESVRADAPFQKLQWSVLLLLQLLLALLFILMLSRPQMRQSGLLTEATVFVVDASASMSADDVRPSRFAAAVAQVQRAVETKPRATRVAIIEAGSSARIVSGLTEDEGALLRSVRALRPSDAAGDMGEALRLASAIVRNQPRGKIVLLSDGVFEDIEDFSLDGATLAFSPIGRLAPNVFFEAFAAGGTPSGDGVLVSINGTYSDSITVPLSIRGDGQLIARLNADLQPGRAWTRTLPLTRDVTRLEARIELEDALASDNIALALGPDRRAIKTLLVSEGNLFLERALNLDPRVTLDRASDLPARTDGYDLVIFDSKPQRETQAPFVVVWGQPKGAGAVVNLSGAMQTRRGGLNDGVSWTEVFIERAWRLTPSPNDVVWAKQGDTPLAVESAAAGQRRLTLPFPILDSDFPLQPSFPILVSNVVSWASRRGQRSEERVVTMRPGAVWSLPDWQRGTLVSPNGQTSAVRSGPDGLRLTQLDRVGWYRVRDGDRSAEAGVSLLSSPESVLTPGRPLMGNLSSGQVRPREEQRFGDIWRWIVLVALCLMGMEWWLYARKS